MTMTERPYMPVDLAMRNDPKIVALESENPAFVTIWTYLLTMIYEQGGYLPTNYKLLAYTLRFPTPEEVRHVVEDFDLFIVEDGQFYNRSALERIGLKEAATQQKREAGRMGGRPRKQTESTPESGGLSGAFGGQKAEVFPNQINKEIKENQSSAGAGAPTREEDDFLIQHFFFKNFKNPGREAGRCLENYKDQEVRNWGKVAEAWEPEDKTPRFNDPRCLQWAMKLFKIVLEFNGRETACELLRHIDDITIDKGRNELTCRLRGAGWKDAVKGVLAGHQELFEGFDAINVSKCPNT